MIIAEPGRTEILAEGETHHEFPEGVEIRENKQLILRYF